MILLKYLQQIFSSNYAAGDYVRPGIWLVSVPILLGVLLYCVFMVLRNWRAPKRAFLRSALLVLATVVGADVMSYVEEAYLRITVPSRNCSVKGPSPFGPYEVVVCVTSGSPQGASNEGFVRLRSTIDSSVLAERKFDNPTFYEVSWESDNVHVGVGDGSAVIHLPPTRWDWFRAKLP